MEYIIENFESDILINIFEQCDIIIYRTLILVCKFIYNISKKELIWYYFCKKNNIEKINEKTYRYTYRMYFMSQFITIKFEKKTTMDGVMIFHFGNGLVNILKDRLIIMYFLL